MQLSDYRKLKALAADLYKYCVCVYRTEGQDRYSYWTLKAFVVCAKQCIDCCDSGLILNALYRSSAQYY